MCKHLKHVVTACFEKMTINIYSSDLISGI